MSKDKGAFGRDEMTALIGGGLSESLLRPKTIPSGTSKTSKSLSSKKDVADMTVQETAAFLLEQQKEKAAKAGVPKKAAAQQARHRTGKVRQYHQLLAEAADADELQQQQKHDESEEEEEFEVRQTKIRSTERAKATPVVVRKRRRRYDSSDDSESEQDEEKTAPPPRRHEDDDSSSSSDSDSEADRRRQRLLKQRSQKQKDESLDAEMKEDQSDKKTLPAEEVPAPKPFTPRIAPPFSNVEKSNKEEKSSSEEESSSSEEESSSSDDDSSSDDEPVIAKPLFVPKHNRGTVKSVAELEAEDVAKEEKLKVIEERRKRESRAMVQQVVQALAQAAPDYENALEGITGASNPMPDDNDSEEDAEQARDAWEVRELERLMEDLDVERVRQEEERELARRRQMTDEERLQEDIASGRYQKPGQQRERKEDDGEKKYAQRYLHRGAYYMDEEEWDQSDVRRKAAEYAQAATEADKVDRTKLPEVMKVKKFGFANQSRYKGLTAEDTTDRHMQMLPLVRDNKKGKEKLR